MGRIQFLKMLPKVRDELNRVCVYSYAVNVLSVVATHQIQYSITNRFVLLHPTAFWKVAIEVLSELDIPVDVLMGNEDTNTADGSGRKLEQRGLAGDLGEEASFFFESVDSTVTDVECPSEAVYAGGASSACLEFTYSLTLLNGGPLDASSIEGFVADFDAETNTKGELYKSLLVVNPDTDVVGLGSPGAGVPYSELSTSTSDNISADKLVSLAAQDEKEVQGSGFGVGGIVGIVIGVLVVSFIAVATVVRRKRAENRRLSEFAGEQLVDDDLEAKSVHNDVVALDLGDGPTGNGAAKPDEKDGDDASQSSSVISVIDEPEEPAQISFVDEEGSEERVTAGSSLAAIGMGSTVTARLSAAASSPTNAEKV